MATTVPGLHGPDFPITPQALETREMRTRLGTTFAQSILCCLALAACSHAPALVPKDDVVRDKVAAISIAHAMWVSMNPSLPAAPESDWQETMSAELEHGVWKVGEPPLEKGSLGGGCEIDILAVDGRFLRAICAQ